MTDVDTLTPSQMAAWLRETARNTRSKRESPRLTPEEVNLAPHVAFRLEQAAQLLEQQNRQLALAAELEKAMADCIGVEDGQIFEQRAEELIVTEVAYQNEHGLSATLSEREMP